MFSFALFVAMSLPHSDGCVVVDMVEINTLSRYKEDWFGKNGRFEATFDQVILWRWHKGRYVASQFMIVTDYSGGEITNGPRVAVSKHGQWYYITAWRGNEVWRMKTLSMRITGGTVDPERLDAKKPENKRRIPYF